MCARRGCVGRRAIRRPVAVAMAYTAVALLGLFSWQNIPIEFLPDTELPKLAERQGALHWLHAYDLAACRGGYTMITPTPSVGQLFAWMAEEGVEALGRRVFGNDYLQRDRLIVRTPAHRGALLNYR